MSATDPVPRPKTCRQLYVVTLPVDLGAGDHIELPPAGLLRLRGSDPEAVARALRLPHRVVVIDEVPLAEAARSAREAREAAVRLALDHDGIAIDMFVPQIITTASADIDIEVSTQWFAISYEGNSTVTHGLDRFGLPELRCDDPDAVGSAMVDAVLVGLAQQTVESWPESDPVGVRTVTLADIARGYGQAPPAGHDRAIRVGVEYTGEDLHMTLLDDPATTLFH